MKKLFLASITLLSCSNAFSQLVVNNTTLTPTQLVQNVLVGTGVTVSNVTFNGAPGNTVTVQAGQFNGSSSNIGLAGGIILASGNAQVAVGPNNNGGASQGPPQGILATDPDLAAITPNQIYDQAVLEFDFVPIGDSISFRYVFASEEYNEYVCASVNDAFGFFISGPGITGPYTNNAKNIATIPGTNTPVSINTVNLGVAGTAGTAGNCSSIDPAWASYNVFYAGTNTQNSVQYDGWTVVLTAKTAVQCGQTYHIKLAIADAGDGVWDSGVFLEGGSLTSIGVDVTVATISGNNTIIEGCSDATFVFSRPSDSTDLTIAIAISGNATNGVDFSFLPDSVYFPVGVDTVNLVVNPIADGVIETTDTLIITVYTITPCGDTVIKTAELYIIDPVPITAEAGPNQNPTCPGQAVNLAASASGGNPPFNYTWSSGAATQNTTVNPMVTTMYYLTVTDICNLVGTDSVLITVPIPAPWNISSQDETTLCPGDPANLSVTVNGGGYPPYTYNWSSGGTTTSTTVNPVTTTTYNFTVTDNCNLDTIIPVTVNVPVYQPLVITISDEQLCLGEGLQVTPVVSGGAEGNLFGWTGPTGTSFVIDQGAGTTFFTNPQNGDYIIMVTDQCSTIAMDTAAYTFVGCEIIIPNVFSPNNDGSNDLWYITNLEYHPNTAVKVYNRWGLVVFESDNYQNTWNGGDVSDGTYFYIVVPQREGYGPYNGTVTILRH
ncbi:MAG: choice-of-anchor L domain-containing protein [Flavobacteriales bacterium]